MDREIIKLQGLITRIQEVENFYWRGQDLTPEQRLRIKAYIKSRYKDLFEWFLN